MWGRTETCPRGEISRSFLGGWHPQIARIARMEGEEGLQPVRVGEVGAMGTLGALRDPGLMAVTPPALRGSAGGPIQGATRGCLG